MSLGELEQVILFAMVRLGGETHGAPVGGIRDITSGVLTRLDRLAEEGG